MKKIKFIIITIILLTTINVKALTTNLDSVKDNYEKYTYIEVTTLNNIETLQNLVNLKEILIKNVSIEDISFINNLNNLNKVSIYYSKINLKNLNNNNIKELDIISSYIINDDLSSINNTFVTKLDLEGTYIKDISTIKNNKTIRELSLTSISNLKSLEPVLSLPNLKILNLGGSEDLITEEVFNYIRSKNIIGSNYRETEYMYLHGEKYCNELDKIMDSLELDNLSILDKIKKITLYVTDFIEYDDCENNNCSYKEISFNRVAKSLSGKGVCYHYALLLNKLLNRIGIDSYLVSGFTTKGIGHEWVNIYLDNVWYAIDPTWIDFNNRSTKLRNTGKTDYYMIKLTDNCNYYKDHIADVLPLKIVDIDKKIIEEPSEIAEKKETENTLLMMILVIISVIIVIIISTYFLIEKLKSNYKKR